MFHDFSIPQIFVEISTRQGMESDYLAPLAPSVIPTSFSSTTAFPVPNPPTRATHSLSGSQLRDSNYMSRILPLHPYRCVLPSVEPASATPEVQETDAESENKGPKIVMKPQLDYCISLE